MADPLSVAASVAGLASLGLQVFDSLIKYYNLYKGQYNQVDNTVEKLTSLSATFQTLEDVLQPRTFQQHDQGLLINIVASKDSCEKIIRELETEYKKFQKPDSSNLKDKINIVGRRVQYPFRQSTLQKLEEDIGDIRENISLALTVLGIGDTRQTQESIAEIKSLVEHMQKSQISSEIRNWLKAPDAFTNYNAACSKRSLGTGEWLLQSQEFLHWTTDENSFLWLNGLPGCGKSVMCSTAIEDIYRRMADRDNVGVAFFYFTFNDEAKQDQSALLRALVSQLSSQSITFQKSSSRLYDLNKHSPPGADLLLQYLRGSTGIFKELYIFLDALDECPQGQNQDNVLDTIQKMRDWQLPNLHLLVTSRDEVNIRGHLDPTQDEEIVLKNDEVDQDIKNFISERLKTDRILLKMHKYHEEIQNVLSHKARGIFRWVECQLESLKRCPKSKHGIDKCLQTLPTGLDETYERILSNINQISSEEARRILTLLSFSLRPLKVHELIHGISIDLEEPAQLNRDRILDGEEDVLEICSGLIAIDDASNNYASLDYVSVNFAPTDRFVRIAHFSVQEYLESDRIRTSSAARYHLEKTSANAEIARLCLTYLQESDLSRKILERNGLGQYHYTEYAVDSWYEHYKNTVRDTSTGNELDSVIIDFLQDQRHVTNALRGSRQMRAHMDFLGFKNDVPSPLIFASFLGLDRIVQKLLDTYECCDMKRACIIRKEGRKHANAMHVASERGHKQLLKIFIDVGADVNAQGGNYGTALQAASHNGEIENIQLLLNAGADVNAQGGEYGTALQAAAALFTGGIEKMKLLLNAGANVNIQGGIWGTALQAAAIMNADGGIEKMKLLLNAGADINANAQSSRGGYGTALQAAAATYKDGVEKLRLLLQAGANANAQGGFYGTALQAAAAADMDGIEKTRLLLQAGANVNTQGGLKGTALHGAVEAKTDGIAKARLLLEAGADINAHGRLHETVLQAAAKAKTDGIAKMKLLLEAGADIDAYEYRYGTALQAAVIKGRVDMVKLLLDSGADVNVRRGHFGTALEAAKRREKKYPSEGYICTMLVDAGAIPLSEEEISQLKDESWEERYFDSDSDPAFDSDYDSDQEWD